jgi:single-strand DNA-binding protein
MAALLGLFRVGKDAETRYLPNGDPVANISLAYNYGKKKDGQYPTQWIDAALWGDRVEKLAPYLTKGKQIFAGIEDVHIETFQKQDGASGFKLTGRIGNLEFAGTKDQQAGAAESAPSPRPVAPNAPSPRPAASHSRPPSGFDDMDDDIPF